MNHWSKSDQEWFLAHERAAKRPPAPLGVVEWTAALGVAVFWIGLTLYLIFFH